MKALTLVTKLDQALDMTEHDINESMKHLDEVIAELKSFSDDFRFVPETIETLQVKAA